MKQEEKKFLATVEIPIESFKDFIKGNVSRGAMHIDEEGHLKFKKYKLGEGRKIGPRKPFDRSLSALYELMEAIFAKFNLKNKGGENAKH